METLVPLYGSVFVSQSSYFHCHTLFRMCTCISTWIYVYPYLVHPLWIVTKKVEYPCVSLCLWSIHPGCGPTPCLDWLHASGHEFMSTWLLMSGPPPCIVWWKPGCPCMAVCLCPSHLISVATPCLECVWASVHEFMSTLHSLSGPPPIDICMGSWVPLCVTACVSQSPYFCSYTLFRLCTCISTWIYVHLAVYVWSTRYA